MPSYPRYRRIKSQTKCYSEATQRSARKVGFSVTSAPRGGGPGVTQNLVSREMRISYRRRASNRGVSATTVGANAKLLRKALQISRRFFWAVFDSRSATPAATAITETGIETSVKPIVSPPYDASLLSADHQSLKPQQIPVNTPRIDALINHPAPSFDKAVAS